MQTVGVKFSRSPDKAFPLQRVNIFLGANGTGKSKLLKELKEDAGQYFAGRSIIYVEGGRTIKLIDTLQMNQNTIVNFSTLERATTTHSEKRTQTLSNRVTDALLLLDKQGQELKESHSDAVDTWEKEGKVGVLPSRTEPPLSKLFTLFSEVFPAITIELHSKSKSLICTKNGSRPYSPTQLSDGEKQVLSVLADIAILAENNSLILIDEPELNLNPSLASRLWDTIEDDLPDCVFVYTTHDIGFSMRTNVSKVFVLSNDENISEITNIGDIQPNDLRALLGSIPAILSTSNALITEGTSNSFDTIFYRWLLGKEQIEIVPMGGGADVQAVANRTGVWKAIAPSVKLLGVIDRDCKSDETLSSLESDHCYILRLHEAESYLCFPEIICTVTQKIGLAEKFPSESEILEIIKLKLIQEKLNIIAKRVFARTTLRLSVAIQKDQLRSVTSIEELEAKLIEESVIQKEYADQELSQEKMKQILEEETLRCQSALDNNDLDAMLTLVPGKSLLSALIAKTGAKNPNDFARACAKHIDVDSFPFLHEEVRERMQSLLHTIMQYYELHPINDL